jgi:hypothetical protein
LAAADELRDQAAANKLDGVPTLVRP